MSTGWHAVKISRRMSSSITWSNDCSKSSPELLLLPFNFAGDVFVLLYEYATTAERIDGAPFGRCHQPQAPMFIIACAAQVGINIHSQRHRE